MLSSLFLVLLFSVKKNQQAFADHSKESEVCTFYLSTKTSQWILPILQTLGFQVSISSNPIYENSQPKIDIIKENISQNVSVLVHYIHEKYFLLTIDPAKLKTIIQPADMGTKSSTGPLLELNFS